MLTAVRKTTLAEIDEQIRSIRQTGRNGTGPMHRVKIQRLESERDWILRHTAGLGRKLPS